ncbi:MAG: hypothetical protein H6867_00435 [Rhodospirillales bacterium]|nr:hypothetical protein [Rhodospirillales bacterium]MCB9996875.1 hypothetical protein [Rhodospirillales bacterium]
MAEGLNTKTGDDAQDTVLSLKSDKWGFLGPTFKTQIPAKAVGNDLFLIDKGDWEATLSPVFERLNAEMFSGKRENREYRAITSGYMAMSSAEKKGFHGLMQAFSAAKNPAELSSYPETVGNDPHRNPHLSRLEAFVDAFNGPAQSVLVDRAQLQGLANAARAALEYATEQNVTDSARDYYDSYKAQKHISYHNGLIKAL